MLRSSEHMEIAVTGNVQRQLGRIAGVKGA
jgi:hypothetical protein